jgi:hypothetical protein
MFIIVEFANTSVADNTVVKITGIWFTGYRGNI